MSVNAFIFNDVEINVKGSNINFGNNKVNLDNGKFKLNKSDVNLNNGIVNIDSENDCLNNIAVGFQVKLGHLSILKYSYSL